LVAIAFVIGLSVQALGQSTYGVLVGTVTDTSGSVIPNAGVEARNQGTDVTSTTHTDSQGDYRLVNMDPGSYTITVSAQSFAVERNENVVLPARETVRSDFKLQVQSVSQQVVVTSRQKVVSEDLTQSSSMSGREIDSLALNFRATNAPSPIGTAALAPVSTKTRAVT
jgi:hypothetical protein